MLGSETAMVPASYVDGPLVEMEGVCSSPESLARSLDAQRELFHSQIDQLQRLVVTQCKLTGVNPLAQEMAAGALSIKIGKKPRDLLNPKAVKYMQSVFSIKDTIGKKETREISALCGVTVTQVREFFAGQRSRVRKLVRLSREKATRSNVTKESLDGCSCVLSQPLPLAMVAPLNSNSMDLVVSQYTQAPESFGNLNSAQAGQQLSVNTTEPGTVQEGSSCSFSQEEIAPDIDSEDKKCLENIFNLMRKEETFSGQIRLMEWILQINNTVILNWFLTKGGVAILASWLSQAALEEQTTVLFVLFKVLCHLPLHKALPAQMSAILQTVNRLRFYRSSDISNRARILLSRWSKALIRNQAMKKPSFPRSLMDSQKELIRKQRINEILSDESWQSKINIPEILALTGSSDAGRSAEPGHGLKLLTTSSDESNRKQSQSVSTSKTKQRRKVLLVDQPDHKTYGRSLQTARATPLNNSRPMSADDIQKAKMRAMFMQSKYGKTDASSENHLQKAEGRESSSILRTCKTLSTTRTSQPQLKNHDVKKLPVPTRKPLPGKMETSPKPIITSWECLIEKLKMSQSQWRSPPVMKVDSLWSIAAGESSKEVEAQTQRILRENETFYANKQDIPLNPKEPWDTEMDYDDSLTLEIPIEQPPDSDVVEGSLLSPHSSSGRDVAEVMQVTTSSALPSSVAPPPPDMELLAVLLKNPELVFALMSGQGSNLTSEQTVALLDMLKKNGLGLAGALNRAAESSRQPEPMSLPSPTPPSESRSGWRSEPLPFTRNPPILQLQLPGSRVAAAHPLALPPTPQTVPTVSASLICSGIRNPTSVAGLDPQAQTTILSMPQLTVTNPMAHNLTLPNVASHNPSPFLHHQIPEQRYQHQDSYSRVEVTAHHSGAPLSQMYNRASPALMVPTPSQNPLLTRPPIPNSGRETNQYNNGMYAVGPTQPGLIIPAQMVGRSHSMASAQVSNEGRPARAAGLYLSSGHPGLGSKQGWNQNQRPEWSGQWNADDHGLQSGPADGSNRWRDTERDWR